MKSRKEGHVTIEDVAAKAGVSRSTVSRVLNNDPRVAGYTKHLVDNAIKELGYSPNAIARNLKTRRSHMIGIIADDIDNMFVSRIVNGIESQARTRGFTIILGKAGVDMALKADYSQLFEGMRVEGIIYASSRIREIDSIGLRTRIPAVCVYCHTREPSVTSVLPDFAGGAYMAVSHLIQIGYTRIAFINGPSEWQSSQERLVGYRRALELHNITFDPQIVREGEWSVESGYRITKQLLEDAQEFDAIFGGNDEIAVGAMDAIKERGFTIPSDIAVIGFDGREFAQFVRPMLTTVQLPLNEMGKLAFDIIFDCIRGEGPDEGSRDEKYKDKTILVGCKLMVRNSTAQDPHDNPQASETDSEPFRGPLNRAI